MVVVQLPRLIKARFSYFDNKGKLYTSADGHIRHDWGQLPNNPRARRAQIIQDNRGTMPGMSGRASGFYIYISAGTSPPFLVLPEPVLPETA